MQFLLCFTHLDVGLGPFFLFFFVTVGSLNFILFLNFTILY